MIGTIFNIQRFCLHDGPGCRTTVFMKGCPLRCKWCHNPEGLCQSLQIQLHSEKCIGCGKCTAICNNHYIDDKKHVIDFGKCTSCSKCAEECPSGAISICGRQITVEELLKEILADRDFYGTKGGVTFSGGEPLLQVDFVVEAAKEAKKYGINVAVDTCGYLPWESIGKMLGISDLFLYDIKAFSDDIHRGATGVGNERILYNQKKLYNYGTDIWIRIPVIPGVNADIQEMKKIADYIADFKSVKQVTLMPYHSFGKSKYETLGYQYNFDSSLSVEEENINIFKKIFTDRNLCVK